MHCPGWPLEARADVSGRRAAPLRQRLAEADAKEARRHIDPLLRELTAAAHQIRTSAREVDRAAQAARLSHWERPLVMFGLGVLLTAITLSLVPDDWKSSASTRRQLYLGQRLETAWPTLGPEEKNQLRTLLGLAAQPEGQERRVQPV